MRLFRYTDIKNGKIPLQNSFQKAKLELIDFLSQREDVVVFYFYGSNERGDNTITSDLDVLIIVENFRDIKGGLIEIVDRIKKKYYVPVETTILTKKLLSTNVHTLTPGYVKHIKEYNSDFILFKEAVTKEEELRNDTEKRIIRMLRFVRKPEYSKKPLSENKDFLNLVGKAVDSFSHNTRKIVKSCGNMDGSQNILEAYKKKASNKHVNAFLESRNFRSDYEKLVLSNPSMKEYEEFLEKRGTEMIWLLLDFLPESYESYKEAFQDE